jgi:hypothetical protein
MPADRSLHIDIHDDAALQRWTQEFDATPEQIRSAVQAVGDRAEAVELRLKGVRATTNRDRMDEARGQGRDATRDDTPSPPRERPRG